MLPQHYPIEPGTLFGGEYPGDRNPEVARTKLLALVKLGVRTFIDLTSPDDHMEPYEGLLAELGQETGMRMRHIAAPIPDMGVPDTEEVMVMIIKAVRDSITTGPAVYVHCWGGICRTGTVVGCWLRECGLGPDEALARVQHLYATHMPKAKDIRYPQSPQTREQKDYIRSWNEVGDRQTPPWSQPVPTRDDFLRLVKLHKLALETVSEIGHNEGFIIYPEPVLELMRYLSLPPWNDPGYDPGHTVEVLRRIDGADIGEVRSVLTAACRSERFCDGAWEAVLRDGVLSKVLRRADQILVD
jgi:hypothetical protein